MLNPATKELVMEAVSGTSPEMMTSAPPELSASQIASPAPISTPRKPISNTITQKYAPGTPIIRVRKNVMMVAGLDRIGEVATRIINGEARRGVAHATSGACLQQNMVVVLEGA